jgi:hypothetical protein
VAIGAVKRETDAYTPESSLCGTQVLVCCSGLLFQPGSRVRRLHMLRHLSTARKQETEVYTNTPCHILSYDFSIKDMDTPKLQEFEVFLEYLLALTRWIRTCF